MESQIDGKTSVNIHFRSKGEIANQTSEQYNNYINKVSYAVRFQGDIHGKTTWLLSNIYLHTQSTGWLLQVQTLIWS